LLRPLNSNPSNRSFSRGFLCKGRRPVRIRVPSAYSAYSRLKSLCSVRENSGFGCGSAALCSFVAIRFSVLTPSLQPTIKITPMPTYEYVCAKCGHQFEKVQPISSKSLTICPQDQCAQKPWGKGKVKRAISTGG